MGGREADAGRKSRGKQCRDDLPGYSAGHSVSLRFASGQLIN
jgi:hypothetical protein